MNTYALRYRISKLIFPEVHAELATEYQAHSRLGGEFCESQRKLSDLESQSRIMTDLLCRVRAVVPDECEGTGILREINRAIVTV